MKIQIVVPVHDVTRPILRAVDSVLRCPDAGVVVVAHGVMPEELNLPHDGRVRVLHVDHGVGFPGIAFNTGVESTTAPWVGIMGSDDWFEEGALQRMLEHLEEDRADGVIAPLRLDTSAENQLNPVTRHSRQLRAGRDRLFHRTAPLGLYRGSIFRSARYRFSESAVSGEDMVASALLYTDGFALSYYRFDPAYVVGSDADARITEVRRPLPEHAAAWLHLWEDSRVGTLDSGELLALAQKLFEVQVLGLLMSRPRSLDWVEGDFEWLSALVRVMHARAPGFEKGFPRSWRAAFDGMIAGDLGMTLLAVRSASYVENRLPNSAGELLSDNSWLRKQLRHTFAEVSHERVLTRAKLEVRRKLPLLPRVVSGKLLQDPWTLSEERQVVNLPTDGDSRVVIGPLNTAGQAKRWADAVAALPKTVATSIGMISDTPFRFPSDAQPSVAAAWHSPNWSEKQWERIRQAATHVLVESGQPILGTMFARDLRRELYAMRREGIRVGAVLHGSDIRVPSLHRRLNPDSPFAGDLGGLTTSLERSTLLLNRFLDASGMPEFVSTPDLIDYRPNAEWLPTLHDAAIWDETILSRSVAQRELGSARGRPVVVHIPSRTALKGSAHVTETLRELDLEGVVEYRELTGLSPREVAVQVSAADVVIDQLTMGVYGVASVEAMAIGKVVIAQVGERVRSRISTVAGCEPPIVEASPTTLRSVVRELASDAERRLALGAEGKLYVQRVHSPERVARILGSRFLDGGH